VSDETTPPEPDEQASGEQPSEAASATEPEAGPGAPTDEAAAEAAAEPAAAEPAAAEPVAEPAAAEPAAAEPAAAEPPAAEPAAAEPPAAEPPAAEPPAGEPAAAEPAPAPAPRPRPPVTGRSAGTGRRKEAVARVRLVPGTGQFDLGGRSLEQVFPNRAHRMEITAPLRLVDHDQDIDVLARLTGGGVSGQAGALRHGIARALVDLDPGLRPTLKAEGFLTRDPREKERRKYGLKKARKAPQYSKR